MKKAMTTTVLVVLIITLAGLVVMLYGIKTWSDITKYSTDKETCKQSVQLKATTKLSIIAPETEFVDIPLRCATQYSFIRNKNDFENGKRLIANDMYDCWDQFGKGEIDFLFSRDYSEKNYCFLCSKIVGIDPSLKDMELTGLGDYLLKEKPLGSGITYAEFLYPKYKDLSVMNKLSLKEPIYVTFFVTRNTDVFTGKSIYEALGVMAGGCVAGAIFIPAVGALPGCAIGFGFAIAGDLYLNPTTKTASTLLLTNSADLVKACQQKSKLGSGFLGGGA